MTRKTKAETFDKLILGNQSCPKNEKCKKIKQGDVESYFVSEVHKFANSGGYIPCSEEFESKKVYVVVLK